MSASSSRASPIGTPNLLRRIPVEMCGWLLASTSGFTRSATRVRRPWRIDSASMRSSSPRDSALMALRPSATARAISAALLPTPVKTIWCGRKPALSATSISPTELQSALAPRPWIRRTRPSVEFALSA